MMTHHRRARASTYHGFGLTFADTRPQGIFGVPLRQSITYANVAISLIDEDGKSYIYGYVPIVVAKCGVFLKEKGVLDWPQPAPSCESQLSRRDRLTLLF
jgi:hypothetical protein